MSNVIPFLGGTQVAIPSHVAALFGDTDSNIVQRQPIPMLRFKGKVWRISKDGEETALMRKNDDGDEVPVPVMSLVVLDQNPDRSRAYYEGAYDPEKDAAPVCWSPDGKVPASDVKEPCSASCATCPNAAKGSKITDNGKAVAACSTFKNLAVVPAADLGFTPLRLRLPITSVYDADNADQESKGWFAWDQYVKFLSARGVTHTATIVTRVKFDPNPDIAYPKLLFSAKDWVDADGLAKVKSILADKKDDIAKLTDTAHGESGGATSAPAVAHTPAKAETKATPAAPKAEPEIDPETGDPVEPAAKRTRKPRAKPEEVAPAAAPAPTPAPQAAPVVVEDDGQGGAPAAGAKAGLTSLLDAWDD